MRTPTQSHWRDILFSWGPSLALMLMIFIASAQPKNPPPKGSSAEQVYFSGAMPVFPHIWDFVIKKSSHILSYGVLTALNVRACLRSNLPLRRAMLLAIMLALVFAFTDEFHQSFVPGRQATLRDIGFDSLGASGALLIVWLIRRKL
jgi:VanZ family protein